MMSNDTIVGIYDLLSDIKLDLPKEHVIYDFLALDLDSLEVLHSCIGKKKEIIMLSILRLIQVYEMDKDRPVEDFAQDIGQSIIDAYNFLHMQESFSNT